MNAERERAGERSQSDGGDEEKTPDEAGDRSEKPNRSLVLRWSAYPSATREEDALVYSGP